MNKELNEKLCRFIGFRPVHDNLAVWYEPQGWLGNRLIYRHELPNFTESLDAQARYLWPKLDSVEVGKENSGYGAYAKKGNVDSGFDMLVYPTPAQACAEAIGKLIQEEK